MKIITVQELRRVLEGMKWENAPIAEIMEAAGRARISGVELLAYLKALSAAPDGFDDQTIKDCAPETATKITAFLKAKGLVTD